MGPSEKERRLRTDPEDLWWGVSSRETPLPMCRRKRRRRRQTLRRCKA